MNDLLQEMLEAAGGLDRWNSVKEVIVTGDMGGMILEIKSDVDPSPATVSTLDAREVRLVAVPFLDLDSRGVFTPDHVKIESLDGSVVKRERKDPLRLFHTYPGKIRRFFWWDALDVLYFAGYSLWNYFVTPFIFSYPGFQTEEISPWTDEHGTKYRRLKVVFPSDVPTHGPEQIFFVHTEGPDKGLINRFQYTALILGPWAKAVHYTLDYKDFSGIKVATTRRATLRKDVFLRRLRMRIFPRSLAMWGDIQRIDFTYVQGR